MGSVWSLILCCLALALSSAGQAPALRLAPGLPVALSAAGVDAPSTIGTAGALATDDDPRDTDADDDDDNSDDDAFLTAAVTLPAPDAHGLRYGRAASGPRSQHDPHELLRPPQRPLG